MQFLISLLCFCILMGTFWASFKIASRPLDYSWPPESASLAIAVIGLVLMLCLGGLPFPPDVSVFPDRVFIAQCLVVAAFWFNWYMLQPRHQKN